jgi:hypothetical protein
MRACACAHGQILLERRHTSPSLRVLPSSEDLTDREGHQEISKPSAKGRHHNARSFERAARPCAGTHTGRVPSGRPCAGWAVRPLRVAGAPRGCGEV